MSSILITPLVCDVLEIQIDSTVEYQQAGRMVTGNKITIRTMGDNWGSPGVYSVMVPKLYMHNHWPLRDPITGLPQIPATAVGHNGYLLSGTYAPTPIMHFSVPLTQAQHRALRRAANGDIGNGTSALTISALHSAGYLAPGTTTITKAGLTYLDYCMKRGGKGQAD